ncbi:MAG: PTS sugar transporter subunit IIA [Spirochaetes bacterium]|jgi:PTS system nitrogen regulatory IIA component|nr:PTS sugar transporter subunit IIA [Spirochaetota bacterium]
MGISHCFQYGTVVPDLSSTDKESAIRELIHRAPVFREFPDLERLAEAVIRRERQLTTGLGHGVAVAHGRVSEAGRVLIGLGLSREGIPFNAPDDAPVHLLFVIASPPEMNLDYLQALSCLVRALREREVREALLALVETPEIERRIRQEFTLCVGRLACAPAG